MSTARETRKKNIRFSSKANDGGVSLGFSELQQKGRAVVSVKADSIKIDGKPLIVHYLRLSMGELKNDFSGLDELEGDERLEKLTELLDKHHVNADGSKFCSFEEYDDLPIDWINAIAFSIIRGASIDDEKNA